MRKDTSMFLHTPILDFVILIDHHGNPAGKVAFCKTCKHQLVMHMDEKYYHAD